MTNETISATITIEAPAETVFGILADPTSHAAIDGTGWVLESLDREHLTGAGQIFRMAMYHDKHPDGGYEMANKVRVFDPPRAISWEPGQDVAGDGEIAELAGQLCVRRARQWSCACGGGQLSSGTRQQQRTLNC